MYLAYSDYQPAPGLFKKSKAYAIQVWRIWLISIAISEIQKSNKSAVYCLPLFLSLPPSPMLAAAFFLPYIRNATQDHDSLTMTS